MISRLVTRTVLVSIITALMWSLQWTWTAEFQNVERVALTVLESSVLLAALSLLLESFLSFGKITVKRDSWTYILFGLYLFDGDRKTPSINARTCELFGVRSTVMAMFSIVTALCLTIMYQIGKATLLFLLNPYILAVNWSEMLWFMETLAVVIIFGLLAVAGWVLIDRRFTNRVVKTLILIFYGSAVFGLTMGVMSIFEPIESEDMPAYLVMLMGTGVALAVASFGGIVFGLAYAIYKFVGKISQRFPSLGDVWNQLCPVQTINFLE